METLISWARGKSCSRRKRFTDLSNQHVSGSDSSTLVTLSKWLNLSGTKVRCTTKHVNESSTCKTESIDYSHSQEGGIHTTSLTPSCFITSFYISIREHLHWRTEFWESTHMWVFRIFQNRPELAMLDFPVQMGWISETQKLPRMLPT